MSILSHMREARSPLATLAVLCVLAHVVLSSMGVAAAANVDGSAVLCLGADKSAPHGHHAAACQCEALCPHCAGLADRLPLVPAIAVPVRVAGKLARVEAETRLTPAECGWSTIRAPPESV